MEQLPGMHGTAKESLLPQLGIVPRSGYGVER